MEAAEVLMQMSDKRASFNGSFLAYTQKVSDFVFDVNSLSNIDQHTINTTSNDRKDNRVKKLDVESRYYNIS